MFLLANGTEVTRADIVSAFDAGHAVLVHGRAENHNNTALMLDDTDRDTRGECYSMWDEVWTTRPATLQDACNAARVKF